MVVGDVALGHKDAKAEISQSQIRVRVQFQRHFRSNTASAPPVWVILCPTQNVFLLRWSVLNNAPHSSGSVFGNAVKC